MRHGAAERIRYGPVPGVAGVETLQASGLSESFDRHFHDTYAFGLILRGVERCRIGRTLHLFEPGCVPMFNPGEVHDGGPANEHGWSYRMVYVDPARVGDERTFPLAERRDPVALGAARSLFDTIDHGSELGVEEALAHALEVLLGRKAHASAALPTLLRVREFIDAHCCEPLHLAELCALAGLSPTRLARAFEAAYGLTPHRYQQSRRIARAKKLIASGTPLAEVAAACGYADQSHLSRWFVRIHGLTPGRLARAFSS